MKVLYKSLNIFIFAALLAMNFKPPTQKEAMQAIGNLKGLPQTLQRALDN
jgi:hypothetical protein